MTSERRDLLVEIGTEELPPKALRALELAFAGDLASGLAKAGLKHAEIKSFATPRRLASWSAVSRQTSRIRKSSGAGRR